MKPPGGGGYNAAAPGHDVNEPIRNPQLRPADFKQFEPPIKETAMTTTTPRHLASSATILLLLTLCPAPGRAEVRTKWIEYDHDDVRLAGYFAWDDAIEGKRPGVLVVHEWWGLNDYVQQRARELAAMGYAAFALDMFGKGKVTEDADQAKKWASQLYGNELMRLRARRGLDVLLEQEQVDADKVAAIGFCFGGTTVLELAYSGAPLAGVVSFHGSLPAPRPQDDANIKAKILICHGTDDPFVSAEEIKAFKQAMQRSGADWQIIRFAGAKHSFTNPAADHDVFEGTAYNKDAAERAWRKMQEFFDGLFGETADQE